MSILPDSLLIAELVKKSKEVERNIKFDYIGKLKSLRSTVTQEVSYVNVLFPEYTPHDNEYHFKNLFNIADDLLGSSIIEKMNVNELFILACALYAHDWGMAVSPTEKKAITNVDGSEVSLEDIVLLQDEQQLFRSYLKEQGYKGVPSEVTDDLWREYIRRTHALRSGVRVNYFFEENSGIAEAIKRACEGHWLGFHELINSNIYPRDYSVLFSTVNLRAITVYTRLIDLLDISEDRTPYVLWKFVSPENEFSNMEWLKHRALSSVKSTDYMGTRIIKIDGKTDDNEVYASLNDLKQWCDDQFRGCIDILAEMNDENHILNISHIHWNIVAVGFEPSSIKFNFDRERLFEILGEQIYGDDPYVFLRELLQNSVDALKLRQAVLAKKGMTLNGSIKVKVQRKQNNDLIIDWKDNGIGMNEYIIANYLTIAGRSFYNSKDFDRIGVKFDAISKFGIGVLSCFTLADRIEISTFREPYLETNSKLINLTIPAYNKYFRMSKRVPQFHEDVEPGTTFRLYISSKKNSNSDGSPKLKSVYEYLSKLAGFVEFPILIEENDLKKVIIHPTEDVKKVLQLSDTATIFEAVQLDLSFDKSTFLPQDIKHVDDLFIERSISLDKDIGIEEFEGVISFLLPREDKGNFYYDSFFSGVVLEEEFDSEVRIVTRIQKKKNTRDISLSCRIDPNCSLYKDGILVPDIVDYGKYESASIKPRLVINIKNAKDNINISRTSLNQKDNLEQRLNISIWNYFVSQYLTEVNDGDRYSSYKSIGRMVAIYGVSESHILDNIPHDKIFAPILGKRGECEFLSLADLKEKQLFELDGMPYKSVNRWLRNVGSKEKYKGIYNYWVGEDLIIKDVTHNLAFYIRNNVFLLRKFIRDNYFCFKVNFFVFSFEDMMPVLQIEWNYIDRLNSEDIHGQIDGVLMKMININTSIFDKDLYILNRYIDEIKVNESFDISIPRFYHFEAYENKFAYGTNSFNILNIMSRKLLSTIANILIEYKKGNLSQEVIGIVMDSFDRIESLDRGIGPSYIDFIKGWDLVLNNLSSISLLPYKKEELSPLEDDFVPFSIGTSNKQVKTIEDYLWSMNEDELVGEFATDFAVINSVEK